MSTVIGFAFYTHGAPAGIVACGRVHATDIACLDTIPTCLTLDRPLGRPRVSVDEGRVIINASCGYEGAVFVPLDESDHFTDWLDLFFAGWRTHPTVTYRQVTSDEIKQVAAANQFWDSVERSESEHRRLED